MPYDVSSPIPAIVQRAYGGAEVLTMGEVPRPEIDDDEVLVEVGAAGVDRGTWHLMAGLPYLVRPVFGLRRPRNPVPGLDVAGTVVERGSAVTRFAVGDEVLGVARGSFAALAAAKADKLALRPARLSVEQAAVVAISGLTAIQALTTVGHAQPGQRVLVLGASGGVGSYAVQIAKALGCEVTGVASGPKLDFVRSLGADHVVDYTSADATDGTRRHDLILDIGGNRPLRHLRRALNARGTLVIVGGEGGGRWLGGIDRQARAMILSPFVRQRLTTFVSKEHFADLERVTALIDEGAVTPALDRSFPLAEAAEALRHLEQGRAQGKVALTV